MHQFGLQLLHPAFLIAPRAVIVDSAGVATESGFHVDGFEAGYVWDQRALAGLAANIRRPKKDGFYDHFQNTAEYVALAFAPGAQPTGVDVAKAARAAVRRSQQDDDEADGPKNPRGRRVRGTVAGSRGGY